MSTEPRRVDAHHHVWDLAVRDQPWTAELPALRRSFHFDDLAPELAAHGVAGTVLVQTITVAEETPEFLALTDDHPEILGVVGWVDLTAPDVADAIAALREGPGGRRLVGIRHQVQGESDPEWLLRADVLRGLAAVADADLTYDLLVTAAQLPAAVAAADRVAGLRWVLDHAGKPPIAAGELDPWRKHITALAANPAVACKLSGLVTEATADWHDDDLAPYADHVITSFGPDRVMFGSDWPVCLLHATYTQVTASVDSMTATLDDAQQQAVWGGTATRWYRLPAG
ncbi:amidohydrolase family protein [Nonomuraea sp. NPDC004354]